MAVIFLYSSIPDLTSTPFEVSDHTGHFVGYGLLGALVLRALSVGRWGGVTARSAALAWLLSTAYGVSDEWHQSFVPGRSPAFDDVVADALGAAAAIAGIVAAAAIRRARSREV
jgi:VanZ family protein